ncbi:hypothetical protein AGMMS4952_17800 [Spirochaetia bacterium]|nr:hypothetical protein AGMMS4952_17800 [Spirochaetia bacterium]
MLPIDSWPAFLLYNPHNDERAVTYVPSGSGIDLFDTVTNTTIVKNVFGNTTLTISPGGALVVVEIPSGLDLEHQGRSIFAGGRYVSSDQVTVSLGEIKTKDAISGPCEFRVAMKTNVLANGTIPDVIDNCVLTIGDKELRFIDTITFNTNDFGSGAKQIRLIMKTKNGFVDYAETRLKFQ